MRDRAKQSPGSASRKTGMEMRLSEAAAKKNYFSAKTSD